MRASRFRTLLYPVFAAMFVFVAVSQPALAQPNQKTATAKKQELAKFRELQMEGQKVRIQLAQIEQKTLIGDKKLQAQRQHFSQHLMKAMQTIGYDPQGDSKKLAQIRQNVASGKLSDQERAAQVEKFRSIRFRLIQGQMAVMRQDKTLQEENRKLSEATLAAMKKQDPHTDALLKRLKKIGQQLQRMVQAAQPHKK